jgi:hypothetical protein
MWAKAQGRCLRHTQLQSSNAALHLSHPWHARFHFGLTRFSRRRKNRDRLEQLDSFPTGVNDQGLFSF